MSRKDNIDDVAFATLLSDLQSDLDAYKTSQLTSGRSGVQSYLTQSASTWDFTGTIGSDSSSSTITTTYAMTFTGNGSQSPMIANLSFAFFVNGTDTTHQLTPVNNFYSDSSGRSASLNYNPIAYQATSASQTVSLITQKAITVYIKVYAVGSCGGTVSAVRTS